MLLLSIKTEQMAYHRALYSVCVWVYVLTVYNKAQRISNREFKIWTFLMGTEPRVGTFLAETCNVSPVHHRALYSVCVCVYTENNRKTVAE